MEHIYNEETEAIADREVFINAGYACTNIRYQWSDCRYHFWTFEKRR